MPSETRTTTDREEIRRWAEEHGGRPARVRGTGDEDDYQPEKASGEDSTFFKLVRRNGG